MCMPTAATYPFIKFIYRKAKKIHLDKVITGFEFGNKQNDFVRIISETCFDKRNHLPTMTNVLFRYVQGV